MHAFGLLAGHLANWHLALVSWIGHSVLGFGLARRLAVSNFAIGISLLGWAFID